MNKFLSFLAAILMLSFTGCAVNADPVFLNMIS